MDDIDRNVIGCLLRNGRATFAEIGSEVGLSAPAAKRQVDRLRAAGAITGFTAVVDPGALGWTTEAYVEVYCTVTVHLLAQDVAHLEQAMERVRSERNVDHTESVIVLTQLIDRPRS